MSTTSQHKKELRLYFDTEFTGIRKNTDLVSIGVTTDVGATFYGEIIDVNKYPEELSKDDIDWLEKNVYSHLKFPKLADQQHCTSIDVNTMSMTIYGTKQQVGMQLINWMHSIWTAEYQQEREIVWVSDVPYYDMVLLNDLLSQVRRDIESYHFEVLDHISPACFDLSQLIAQVKKISINEAFDLSREDLVREFNPETPSYLTINLEKHNALYDAKIIQYLYTQFEKSVWNWDPESKSFER